MENGMEYNGMGLIGWLAAILSVPHCNMLLPVLIIINRSNVIFSLPQEYSWQIFCA